MLSSIIAWLSKLDPNVVAPIVISVVVYVYHTIFSASAQAKVASAIQDALNLADSAIAKAISLAPAGTTQAQLEADLLGIAKSAMTSAGLDPNKLPAYVTTLIKALVNDAIADWKAAQPPAPAPAPAPTPIAPAPKAA